LNVYMSGFEIVKLKKKKISYSLFELSCLVVVVVFCFKCNI
jgi:hypothetical protein